MILTQKVFNILAGCTYTAAAIIQRKMITPLTGTLG